MQLKRAVDIKTLPQLLLPPSVQLTGKLMPISVRIPIRPVIPEPDEHRVGITVDHLMTKGLLDPLGGLLQNLMATQGDGTGQALIEKNGTFPRAQYAIAGVHLNLDRLRQGRVTLPLGFISRLPKTFDYIGQQRMAAVKNGVMETRHQCIGRRITVSTQRQPQRINPKAADDAGVQALEVQHQHMTIQPGTRFHHESARNIQPIHTGGILGCHISGAVQTWQVEVIKRLR